jgi:protein-S-isoprenylcysteine O-methyltransferase Ste14
VTDVPRNRRSVTRWVVREISGTVMAGAILVATSGRWDWTMGWALVGVYAATFAAQAIILIPRCPELLAERSARMGKDTKAWDRILLPFYGLTTLAVLVVAGLDLRFGWGPHIPIWLQYLGLVLALFGNGLVTWSMTANAFFAFSVRLQRERGQTVATGGPYRVVRHPGYAGAAIFALATALLLGSVWSLIPGAAAVLLLVVRTSLEDRTLKAELEGYADYARRTRFRLLPGTW